MWHKGSGKIIYDPKRGAMKKRTKWWCVVNVDREITRYYRWWINKQYHIKGLCRPSWDAHISIIRGEKPEDDLMHLWKKYNGEIVTFEYEHFPKIAKNKQDGHFWLVNVRCDKFLQIRKELNRPTNWNLHLTVGRTYY